MAVLVTPDNKNENCELMKEIYSFRHRHFVEDLGWEDLRKANKLEKDQFDDLDDVYHLVERDANGISFYSRLMPTTGPTLLADVYPELLEGRSPPSDNSTWEWTRGATRKPAGAESGAADPISKRFYVSAFEAFNELGIRKISLQTHPLFMTRMLQAGHSVTPLCLPTLYKNEPIVAFTFEITEETLPRLRRRLGLFDRVLQTEVSFDSRDELLRVVGHGSRT